MAATERAFSKLFWQNAVWSRKKTANADLAGERRADYIT
jgi:hypothetical protein